MDNHARSPHVHPDMPYVAAESPFNESIYRMCRRSAPLLTPEQVEWVRWLDARAPHILWGKPALNTEELFWMHTIQECFGIHFRAYPPGM